MLNYCGYFNNPFITNSFFMPNFSFGFSSTCFFTQPMFSFMPSFFIYNPMMAYNQSIFKFLLNNNSSNNADLAREVKGKPVVKTGHNSADRKEERAIRHSVSVSKVKKDLGPDFLKCTKQIAKNLNCNYKDLLALMQAESGLNPKAVNPNGGATGLIQFMPKTAKELGTSTQELKQMTPIQQLDYVEKYFVMTKKMAGYSTHDKLMGKDLYALTFLPAKAKNEVLTDSNNPKLYLPNKGLDINRDGKITKSELAQRIISHKINESIFA